MKYYVKNWKEHQHYKDRNPPWIKLHYALLSSEDWVMLDDASRVLAVAILLVASKNDGYIDGSERGLKYLSRVAYLNQSPDLKPLIETGFLTPAIKALADASTMQADARPEESRAEKSRAENIGAKPTRFVPPTPDEVSRYCKERKNLVDAERFVDFYAAKGWMVGKNKMKDWKAAVRTWEANSKTEAPARKRKML